MATRRDIGDGGALKDYTEAIRLPDEAIAFNKSALRAATRVIWRGRCRISTRPSGSPDLAYYAFINRALSAPTRVIWRGAADYNEAIRLKPDDAVVSTTGAARRAKGDLRGR